MEPRLPSALSGTGRPALIVPIYGRADDLPAKAQAAVSAGADLVEWRADLSEDWDACAQALADVSVPVIATIRTDSEGGSFPDRGSDYATAVLSLAAKRFDVIDIEIGRAGANGAIAAARASGIPVIASHHSFEVTPRDEEILAILDDMAAAEADLLKIAFTPVNEDDTWRQMALSRGMQRRYGVPIISISMGPDAAWTRLAARACGSAATFASVGDGSAPGQLDAELVRSVLDALAR